MSTQESAMKLAQDTQSLAIYCAKRHIYSSEKAMKRRSQRCSLTRSEECNTVPKCHGIFSIFLCSSSTFFLRILFSFFTVHPTLPQATFFLKIPTFWVLKSTLSCREKATCRGWVLGTVLDGVAPQEKGKILFFFLVQKAADVWKKDVWDFQAFSQTFLELRFSLGNEGKDGKNLNSQTWPGTPRRPSFRHPRPPDWCARKGEGSDWTCRRTPNANECCFARHSSLGLLCCIL